MGGGNRSMQTDYSIFEEGAKQIDRLNVIKVCVWERERERERTRTWGGGGEVLDLGLFKNIMNDLFWGLWGFFCLLSCC